MPTDRGLVDDVVTAALVVLRRFPGAVVDAGRPWAYLMSSAQRMVAEEVRAQQLLTGTTRIRGRARDTLPRWVRPIGSTPVELATAFRHEPAGELADVQGVPQVGNREEAPLAELLPVPTTTATSRHDPWLTAFVDLLVEHGADPAVTTAALDRLADLFLVTPPSGSA